MSNRVETGKGSRTRVQNHEKYRNSPYWNQVHLIGWLRGTTLCGSKSKRWTAAPKRVTCRKCRELLSPHIDTNSQGRERTHR